nr:DapH/DapD/GlmU-related protein [Acuticoccus kalidii]
MRHVGLCLDITIGSDCIIGPGVRLETGRSGTIIVGDDTLLDAGCALVARRLVSIGSNVALADGVIVSDDAARIRTVGTGAPRGSTAVVIGDNVLVGRNTRIGPGTRLGAGTVVAPNSVVQGVFPPNVYLCGVPATVHGTAVTPPPRPPMRASTAHRHGIGRHAHHVG